MCGRVFGVPAAIGYHCGNHAKTIASAEATVDYDRGTRTEFASKAMQLSALFEMKFRKLRFGGNLAREVKVSEQMGESSGGGKMARESIMLSPIDGTREEAIVVGWMDVGNSVAEIRSYNTIAARYQQRFHNVLTLPQTEYKSFIDEVATFFQQEGIVTTIVDSPPPSARVPTQPEVTRQGSNTLVWVLLLIILLMGAMGAAALAAFFLFL